ncbi:MAG TPA: hypothetical protein VJN50_09600 [Actinomycetota bacterium]|nr:hypothetical protein [Actinomycetota bacterium]
MWAAVAERALAEGSICATWASPSTLLACAPADVSDAELTAAGQAEASKRGTSYPAPIHRADGPGDRWTFYRGWFPSAAALDDGELRAAAFYDPDTAARFAAEVVPEHSVAYDDSAGLLSISTGDVRAGIDAVIYSFMGLMRGFFPEQMLAAAVQDAGLRLGRLASLRDRAASTIAAEEVRFADAWPVYRTATGIVVDSLAASYLDGGDLPEDWSARLRSAAVAAFSTPCTCREERRVGVVLRRSAEIESVDELALEPVNEAFCAIYQLGCSHASRRPRRTEWEAAGYDGGRRQRAWWETANREALAVADESGWLWRAAVVHGREVGALAASPPLAGALAAALGFPPETVTLYAARANLLFITDEPFSHEAELRESLRGGGLEAALAEQGLHLGREVGYLTRLALGNEAPLEAPIRALRTDH